MKLWVLKWNLRWTVALWLLPFLAGVALLLNDKHTLAGWALGFSLGISAMSIVRAAIGRAGARRERAKEVHLLRRWPAA